MAKAGEEGRSVTLSPGWFPAGGHKALPAFPVRLWLLLSPTPQDSASSQPFFM